jgi:hypothetical protein
MLFGMTRGEIGLVVLIFGLVYVAAFLPRMGAWLGDKLFARAPGSKPKESGDG